MNIALEGMLLASALGAVATQLATGSALAGLLAMALAARVLREEHRIYPAALATIAAGRPAPAASNDAALANPLPPGIGLP